jgi:hypothetical protein
LIKPCFKPILLILLLTRNLDVYEGGVVSIDPVSIRDKSTKCINDVCDACDKFISVINDNVDKIINETVENVPPGEVINLLL